MKYIKGKSNFSIYKGGKLVHRVEMENTEQNQKHFLLSFCIDNKIELDKEIELPVLDYLMLKIREYGFIFETF